MNRRHKLKPSNKMWFGKYKGTKLKDIPVEYFQYLLENNICFRGIKDYCKQILKLK